MSDEDFKDNELYHVTEKPSTFNLIFDFFFVPLTRVCIYICSLKNLSSVLVFRTIIQNKIVDFVV